MAKRPINLRLDQDLIDAADALAAAVGIDRTELISRGLRRELLYEGQREFVYVLLDADRRVRYVGRSCDPYRRLREHLAVAKAGGRSARDEWLAEMLRDGRKPTLAIIDDAEPGEEIHELEMFWIEHFDGSGVLTNGLTAGVAPDAHRLGASVNTSVRLPSDLHAWLVSEAERLDRSAGWIIVKALRALEADARQSPA